MQELNNCSSSSIATARLSCCSISVIINRSRDRPPTRRTILIPCLSVAFTLGLVSTRQASQRCPWSSPFISAVPVENIRASSVFSRLSPPQRHQIDLAGRQTSHSSDTCTNNVLASPSLNATQINAQTPLVRFVVDLLCNRICKSTAKLTNGVEHNHL